MRAIFAACLLFIASCLSVEGSSAPPAPSAQNAAPVAAMDDPIGIDLPAAYRLDPRHASLLFRIRHEDLSWFTARFDMRDATLELAPNNPLHSRLSARVDATSAPA